jgi:hypothetical protein
LREERERKAPELQLVHKLTYLPALTEEARVKYSVHTSRQRIKLFWLASSKKEEWLRHAGCLKLKHGQIYIHLSCLSQSQGGGREGVAVKSS